MRNNNKETRSGYIYVVVIVIIVHTHSNKQKKQQKKSKQKTNQFDSFLYEFEGRNKKNYFKSHPTDVVSGYNYYQQQSKIICN